MRATRVESRPPGGRLGRAHHGSPGRLRRHPEHHPPAARREHRSTKHLAVTERNSTAHAVAQPTCPLTQVQVDQAFGETLPGPLAPLNAYEVCVFGQATPGNYHVVTVSVYNAATLAGFGSTASAYLQSNRGTTAVSVPNVGVAAFIKGGDIWVQTPDQAILDIGSDFVVTNAELQAAAVAALPRV